MEIAPWAYLEPWRSQSSLLMHFQGYLGTLRDATRERGKVSPVYF